MVDSGRTKAAYVFTVLILELSIIHIGVGIGIVGRYYRYSDIFRQPMGLSVFNIVIGIFGIITGILGLITISQQRSALTKIVAIVTVVLGIFAIASLIAGLVVNSQAINGVRSRLSYRMNSKHRRRQRLQWSSYPSFVHSKYTATTSNIKP
ncbi:unnamed protein product [Rotaria magnacalcarata]|uniref:Uncharacterized protein n=1 Tax=Rotaria magnacalcarata TaxID=392030 RepID=A0A8S2SGI5_9BILA|nr:unnamed protein product [Rotaria magnacalcarata]